MKTNLLNRVENIVSKGEIARLQQLFLLIQSFQKSSAADASESVCMSERVNFASHFDAFAADDF